MQRIHHTLLILIATMLLSSCAFWGSAGSAGPQEAPTDQQEDGDRTEFLNGYKRFDKGQYRKAVLHFYRYLDAHTPDDEDYEWAAFFFGISLKKIGLSHAAVDIIANLVKRKPNPKIVSYSLELLEELTRTQPFDRDLVIHQVLCDESYGFVSGELSDFIHYHQGVYDWQHGFADWGDDHFSLITPESYYYYRYLYQKALYHVYHDKVDEAILLLEKILTGWTGSSDYKDDVRQTLARLLYEKDEFQRALQLHMQVEAPVLEQAQNLMDRSWIRYQTGEYEKSMGLLYAFRAPAYKNMFTPEYYILRSFIYKGVCHYQEALQVIDEFKLRYGPSLEMIYNRSDPKDNYSLLLVVLQKRQIRDLWRLLELLEEERAALEKLVGDPALHEYVDRIYALEIDKVAAEFKDQVTVAYEEMANDLLKYEEESHLMEYEIGLDMYQRVQAYHYGEEDDPSSSDQPVVRTVAYPFQGEFWSDELDDYQVTLPNRCESTEEWDVFFK